MKVTLKADPNMHKRNGIVKVIVIVVLAVLVGVAFTLMSREQQARRAVSYTHLTLPTTPYV